MTTWTQVDSLDAPSGGVFDFPSLTLTGYQVLHVVLSEITVTTDGTDVKLTFYVSGSEITSGYRWGMQGILSNATGADDGSTSASAILLCSDNAAFDAGNDTGEGFGGLIVVDNPLSAALHKKAGFETVSTNPAGRVVANRGIGIMENTGAIGGLKISGTSNLTAGKVRILGMA